MRTPHVMTYVLASAGALALALPPVAAAAPRAQPKAAGAQPTKSSTPTVRPRAKPKASPGTTTLQPSGKAQISKAKPQVLLSRLKAQQFSGDFAKWVEGMSITDGLPTLFSWKPYGSAHSYSWQVTEALLESTDPGTGHPSVVAEGPISVSDPSKNSMFKIDLGKVIPKNASSPPKTYFVRVLAKSTPTSKPRVVSSPVALTHVAPHGGTKFTNAGLKLDVKGKHPELFAMSPLPVDVRLEKLHVGRANEKSGDEPYLFAAVIWVDGTQVNVFNLASGEVRLDHPNKAHGNLPSKGVNQAEIRDGTTVSIPTSTGHYARTMQPLGKELADIADHQGKIGQAMLDHTKVYVVVAGLEEDETTDAAAEKGREAFQSKLKQEVESIIQSLTLADLRDGKTPEFDVGQITERVGAATRAAMKDATVDGLWWKSVLMPWSIASAADPDDLVGAGVAEVSFGQLLKAGAKGVPFSIELTSPGNGYYTVQGRVRRK